MKNSIQSRRNLLARLSAFFGAGFLFRGSHATTPTPPFKAPEKTLVHTPAATEGPFYPRPSMLTSDIDNDLVKIEGRVNEAGGEIITLRGQVRNSDGQLLSGIRVEIWQCDFNGKYLHTGDRQNIAHDSGFQGFGHDITNDNGEYSFRTIKPAKYPGRAEHIHVKLRTKERDLLTTQFYIDGEPNNQRDGIFRTLSKAEADSVSMRLAQTNGQLEAVVDIVV